MTILGHDARNPLGAIRMGAQLMLLDEQLAEKHRTVATRILGSTKRVTDIVNDLIDYSTGDLGSGMPIKPAPFDFKPVCRHVVDELRAFAHWRWYQRDIDGIGRHVVYRDAAAHAKTRRRLTGAY
jgi:signal transduction histidine kinase